MPSTSPQASFAIALLPEGVPPPPGVPVRNDVMPAARPCLIDGSNGFAPSLKGALRAAPMPAAVTQTKPGATTLPLASMVSVPSGRVRLCPTSTILSSPISTVAPVSR